MEDFNHGFELINEELPKPKPTTLKANDQHGSPEPIPVYSPQLSPAIIKRVQDNYDSIEILKNQISTDKKFQENLLEVLKERNRQDLEFHQKMLSQQDKIISLMEVAVKHITEK